MLGTKVEIKMKKAELKSWTKLEYPRKSSKTKEDTSNANDLVPRVESVDLDGL